MLRGTCCIVFFAGTVFCQRPVVVTESALTLGPHRFQIGVGADYMVKHEAPARDLPTRAVRIFVSNLNLGVADNVDFSLEWLGGYIAMYRGGRKAYDWGDLMIATKIRILGGTDSSPAIGFRSAVKLPNTSYLPLKLGSDQTDYFFQVLCSANLGGVEARLNAGFGIVGSPTSLGIQNDVFTYSGACCFTLGEHSRTFVELAGMNGYFADDSKLVARAGFSEQWLGVGWNLYGSLRVFGDGRDFATAFDLSENWSFGILLSKDIRW